MSCPGLGSVFHFLLKELFMDEKKRRNVLILDPERDTAELFMRALETHTKSCKCYWVKTSDEAQSLLSEISFDFLLADFSLLEQDGFLLLEAIREVPCRTLVVVDAYISQNENIKKVLNLGATGYFIKPIMINSLRKLIDDLGGGLRQVSSTK